jgi:hypothetical protein
VVVGCGGVGDREGGAEGLAVFGEGVGEVVGEGGAGSAGEVGGAPAEQLGGEGGEVEGAGEGAQALLRLADLLGDDRLGGEQGVRRDDEADRLEVADPLLVGGEDGVVGPYVSTCLLGQAETGQR